jgi:flagellar assembly factor FliW
MLTMRSTRFGTVDVPENAVIDFPAGLIGLPGRRYALLMAGANGLFEWLHSMERPDVALAVTDPHRCFEGFALALSKEDAARVGGADPSEARVYATVRLDGELQGFIANLRAPIVISGGRGFQVINHARGAFLQAVIPSQAKAAA